MVNLTSAQRLKNAKDGLGKSVLFECMHCNTESAAYPNKGRLPRFCSKRCYAQYKTGKPGKKATSSSKLKGSTLKSKTVPVTKSNVNPAIKSWDCLCCGQLFYSQSRSKSGREPMYCSYRCRAIGRFKFKGMTSEEILNQFRRKSHSLKKNMRKERVPIPVVSMPSGPNRNLLIVSITSVCLQILFISLWIYTVIIK